MSEKQAKRRRKGNQILKRIIAENLEDYQQSNKSVELKRRPHLYRWLENMVLCGSLWLGVNIYQCSCGSHVRYIPIPCKTKVCMRCGWAYQLKQKEKTLNKVLRCKYMFMTFTIHHGLQFIFETNRKIFLTAMFQAITATVTAYLKSEKLNVKVGIIGVDHTFNAELGRHVHFHVLISCGGMDVGTKKWVDIKFYPILFLRKTFQAKFMAKLRSLHREHKLVFEDKRFNAYKKFNEVVSACYVEGGWHTHIADNSKRKIRAADQVRDGDVLETLEYALRYLNRLPISEKNILIYDRKKVLWLPKKNRYESEWSHRNLRQKETPVFEFMEILFQHIPDKNERTIYYSGLYAPCESKRLLIQAKEHFKKKESVPFLNQSSAPHLMGWKEMRTWHAQGGEPINPLMCQVCKTEAKFAMRKYFKAEFCRTHTLLDNQIVPIAGTVQNFVPQGWFDGSGQSQGSTQKPAATAKAESG